MERSSKPVPLAPVLLIGGIELPVAVSMTALSASLVEIVPVLRAGYLKVGDGDKREGFTLRGSFGMRFLFDGTAFYLTFEPFSVVLLPAPATNGRKPTRDSEPAFSLFGPDSMAMCSTGLDSREPGWKTFLRNRLNCCGRGSSSS